MRRVSAVLTASFLLLALSGSPIASQSPSPAVGPLGDHAAVTGKNYCGVTQTEGTWQETTAPYTLTGMVLGCSYVLSDPRVSGKGTVELNIETWRPGFEGDMVEWGGATIEGPEGTWSGSRYGIYDTDGVVRDMTILAGSGAYEGWTFVFSTTVLSGTTGEIIGVLHHSPPPPGYPVGPLPSPASE